MARAPKPPVEPDDAPLKRLGGGRWQTRDERFTIEPQSGTWVVVDGEQTDDLGMALVRGPFPSLTAAKDAIATARSSGPAASPLTERIEQRRLATPKEAAPAKEAPAPRSGRRASDGERPSPDDARADAAGPATRGDRGRRVPASTGSRERASTGAAATDEPAREPGWLTDLEPAERGRARRLIARLVEDGVSDAEGLVRRDLVGDVPALAAAAIARRLVELGADATPDEVASLLADGRDDRLDVRWRLVDADGRPIVLERSRARR
jgi:hypothetical protein